MATYAKMIQESKDRRRKLQASIQSHRKSIAELEREVKDLDGVIAALGKLSKAPTGPGRKVRAGKSSTRRRGTWKPGKPGRPPKWFQAKKAAGAKTARRKTSAKRPTAKRPTAKKRKLSPKQLAALAKARAARIANLKKGRAAATK